MPLHRELADAQRNAGQRLAEMNTPGRLNLVRIIDVLEAVRPHREEEAYIA